MRFFQILRKYWFVMIVLAVVGASAAILGARAYTRWRAVCEARELKRAEEARRVAAWKGFGAKIVARARSFNGDAGIVIKDLATGMVVRVNDTREFAAASMVKIPIMAACFKARAEGKLKFDDLIRLKKKHKVLGSGTLKFCPLDTPVAISELLRLMIDESDNTATNMLIDLLGYDYLNDTFRRLGLKNTVLKRDMMDFKSRARNIENYTTASDIALLLEAMYRGRLINEVSSKECIAILKAQKMHDRIPRRLPSGTVVAHKTGLERSVCHDAGIVYAPHGDYLISVLTRHNESTARSAKFFIADLALDTYRYYEGPTDPKPEEASAKSVRRISKKGRRNRS